ETSSVSRVAPVGPAVLLEPALLYQASRRTVRIVVEVEAPVPVAKEKVVIRGDQVHVTRHTQPPDALRDRVPSPVHRHLAAVEPRPLAAIERVRRDFLDEI